MALQARKAASIVAMAAVALSLLLTAAPASAAPERGQAQTGADIVISLDGIGIASATGCNSNVCMHLSTPSNAGYVFVRAWARSSTFTGWFDLDGPLGLRRHGPTDTWVGGGSNNTYWPNIPAVVGKYCVRGWTTGGTLQGLPCLYVE